MLRGLSLILSVSLLSACSVDDSASKLASQGAPAGPSFGDIWSQVEADPYTALPHYETTLASLFTLTRNLIKEAGASTLANRSDLRPPYQKLVHPNGLCLAGTWSITEDSPYTGYFANGSKGLIIVRASAATSATTRGSRRAFGFAGKIFPTENAAQGISGHTANFFTVDDLGGTRANHYLDVAMTNEPKTSLPPITEIPFGIAVLKAFEAVDSHASIRQVYEIAELGMANPAAARSPHWLRITAHPGQALDDAADFRSELHAARLANGGQLVFDISVASPSANGPTWQKVGTIALTDDIASLSCDQSLHFHHPRWRDDVSEL